MLRKVREMDLEGAGFVKEFCPQGADEVFNSIQISLFTRLYTVVYINSVNLCLKLMIILIIYTSN